MHTIESINTYPNEKLTRVPPGFIGILVIVAIFIAWFAEAAVRNVDTGVALGITFLVLGDLLIEKRRKQSN